ncbi:hypothetical protein PLESTB_001072800 [Pleodorina starrii]|uniref:DUF7912 domain-containing protein n=1 Tax=Pleodorina starrii TaxID=330485 RepID=A0A9W6BQ78_9CHLO|nr:hypothetical protein PLESTB_001072800 [Pleodorina starrii]GLC74979.1 hypothetical protein PLESTF_001579200 [Pleodorina starrii]
MSPTAGVRMAGVAKCHTSTLADSRWPSPMTPSLLRPLPHHKRTMAPGGCPLPLQPACVDRLPTPRLATQQRRPSTSICAAARADKSQQSAAGHAEKSRLADAAADPRDVDALGSSSSSNRRQRQEHTAATAAAAEGRLDEDGVSEVNGDEEEGELAEDEFEEAGDDAYDEDEDEGGDFAQSFLEPDDAPREVATGGTAWGEVVLRAARGVLDQPAMKGLDLYLFRALPANRKVDIRLDKLDDMYGSPSIDDIERFQRGLFAALDREMGPEAAGEISFEVSSPGAERLVRVPDELTRFAELPLKVEYRGPDGKDTSSVLLMADLDTAAGSSSWRLANVRANATVKGRALSKRQLSQLISIPLADISRVRIHVDF